jgi:hypothetical protein
VTSCWSGMPATLEPPEHRCPVPYPTPFWKEWHFLGEFR